MASLSMAGGMILAWRTTCCVPRADVDRLLSCSGTRSAVLACQGLDGQEVAAPAQAGNDALADRLKSGAVKRAKTFDMMVQAKKMVDVYEQAIEDKRAGRKVRISTKEFR